MPRTAVALRHVPFEDLDGFAPVLAANGYSLRYHDLGRDDSADLAGLADPADCSLLFVLGGPISANDEARYPFLTDELRLLERRLAGGHPVMGICLGGQLMARALGAAVRPGARPEIGFAPLTLTDAGQRSALAALAEDPVVLHWHGEGFDLPEGCDSLAHTPACPHQAFSRGPKALALQCHPEATGRALEAWLIGHAVELDAHGIDIPALRTEARQRAPALTARATAVMQRWLAGLEA